MISRASSQFWRLFRRLPGHVQEQAHRAHELFLTNAAHPSLRFRQVHQSRPIYSARVGLGYRVLGVRDDDTVVWFWIGTHADYDHLLKSGA